MLLTALENIKALISKCFTRFQHLTYVVSWYIMNSISNYIEFILNSGFREFDVKMHMKGLMNIFVCGQTPFDHHDLIEKKTETLMIE